jgi:hypothetical protein
MVRTAMSAAASSDFKYRLLATAWSSAREASGSRRQRFASWSHFSRDSDCTACRYRVIVGSSASKPETGISATNGA